MPKQKPLSERGSADAGSKSKLTTRDKYLRTKYDITEATYFEMVRYGNGCCWICRRQPKPGKALNVDHQHLTKLEKKSGTKFGRVRGLLCFFCNKYLIGRRKAEHAYMFRNAAGYLEANYDWRTHGINDKD